LQKNLPFKIKKASGVALVLAEMIRMLALGFIQFLIGGQIPRKGVRQLQTIALAGSNVNRIARW
jgi:hypothetical protein